MACYLGIDTSNYTTSVAVYDDNGSIIQKKKLLEVKDNQKGLQQSEAVFQHIIKLPLLMQKLLCDKKFDIKAVGATNRPRDIQNSYMPCFMVGDSTARSISATYHLPYYDFSHQAGHIAAALYSIQKLELINQRFLAFHVSGGTTEAILCEPNELNIINTQIVAQSLDLKAGQAIDRVGIMLGLKFPCGVELEKLALKSDKHFNIKPTLKGLDCCLSGLENKCSDMYKLSEPFEDIALYCLQYILKTLDNMAEQLIKQYKNLPLVFTGGVMSNSIIRQYMQKKYGAFFAIPEFSSDNAAGIAVLTKIRDERK
jgi:N6-L-threonylcarbamoyladenine synthase